MTNKEWLEDFESMVQSVRLDILHTCNEVETLKEMTDLLYAVFLLHQAQLYIGEAKGLIGEE